MQVPKITQAHLDAADRHFTSQRYASHAEFVNKAIEIALAEQSQEQYITAAQARELGVGNAEYQSSLGVWKKLDHDFYTHASECDDLLLYRAIKQPEPAEPTCQIKNLDTGITKTMTREAAKLLQAETKDVCDWFCNGATDLGYGWLFEQIDAIYTYKLRNKNTSELTQARLKEVLHYDVYTGIFTWLISSGRAKPNKPAGTDSGKGYTQIWIDGKSHYAHRLAWLYVIGDWPKEQIDHINGNRSDNSFRNLRQATHAENLMNIGMTKTNTSGYKGVSWSKRHSKWYAQIRLNNKVQSLGHFDDIVDAANAYKKADLSRGEFSRQNSELKANLANLVRLAVDDGEPNMLTPAQCEAERLARIDTHYLGFKKINESSFYTVTMAHKLWVSHGGKWEYRLIPNKIKQIEWTGSREDVIALLNELGVTK